MATLNTNATSFAAANWSDATGFADSAVLVAADGNQPVVTALDYSTLTEGIEEYTQAESFRANVGTPANPLKCDADASADARIQNYSPYALHYEADGDENLCNVLRQGGTGSTYVYGGTVTQTYQTRGYLYVNASTVVTDLDIAAGRSVIENNATGINSVVYHSGQHVLKRDCDADGTITVKKGATVTIDIPDASPTVELLVELGGKVIVKECATIAKCDNNGTLNIDGAKGGCTLGATRHNQGPYAVLVRGTQNTITEPTFPHGIRDAGSPQGGPAI